MKKSVDVVYVVASKLGSIGMGTTSLEAVKGIERKGFSYKGFCRGYNPNIKINKKNLTNYSFLEYLSYPFRFVEKFLGFNINSFKFVNYLFGKLVYWNLPKSKTYHTWMGVAPEAIKKAKRNGSILVLEAANSHPLNSLEISNTEYKLIGKGDFIRDEKEIKESVNLIKQFDYVMCPSDFVYDSFLKQGFKREQLVKMPYGVDTKKFVPLKDKKQSKKLQFIFVGSVQVRKGIHYLLQAWDELKLKNAELVICGRVWPDSREIVEKYKKNKTIKFLSFVKPKGYLQNSDVFVSPSLEEGSALTCYEAMACGLPLIATFNTGSVARNGKDGFIIPAGNVKALKEKILYFYNNPKEIEKMGKSARKHVENFTWENYGRRLSKFYKEILSQ